MSYDFDPRITRYLQMVEDGEINACKDQHRLAALIRHCFKTEDICTDSEQLAKYLSLAKYFPFDRLFEWQDFCIALHLCTYWRESGLPRWPDLFLLIGRGAGKDGYMAVESTCLISPYNGIPRYDVDICANSEEQAMRPVEDIVGALSDPAHAKKLKQHFYWTQERVRGIKTRGTIRGRTRNSKTKDGMRSGMVAFNEIHQYQNYDNIKVYVSGQGKVPHPRRLYATTNGDVRDGPLDDMLALSEQILALDVPDNGLLPFICRIDDKSEADIPAMWEKANPSLPYLPSLRVTIEKEYAEWKQNPVGNADFMTKRMNLPHHDAEIAVTSVENIKATNRPIPQPSGRDAVIGIDMSSISDLCSAGILFRDGETRYFVQHSWLCLKSKDLARLKIPWREWGEEGRILTLVDDESIPPEIIGDWLESQTGKYNLKYASADHHRWSVISPILRQMGYDNKGAKNLKMVRPSDIMQISPLIESCFVRQQFVFDDDPLMRWAVNNTKMIRTGINRDTGNMTYGKIEPKSRKNDPFMALVAAMTWDEMLEGSGTVDFTTVPLVTWG